MKIIGKVCNSGNVYFGNPINMKEVDHIYLFIFIKFLDSIIELKILKNKIYLLFTIHILIIHCTLGKNIDYENET